MYFPTQDTLRRICPPALAFFGINTMLISYGLTCLSINSPYRCSSLEIPTISYASYWDPVGYTFGIGMGITSLFCAATTVLFANHFKKSLKLLKENGKVQTANVFFNLLQLALGLVASGALLGLAIFNMKLFHDRHVYCATLFFASNWLHIMLLYSCISKMQNKKLLKAFSQTKVLISFLLYIISNIFSLGFGCLYILVNIQNIEKLTGLEGVVEFCAIIAQLLFMGSLGVHMNENAM
mmetsp:Transcript_22824/g.31798  ORF Transcript_22824/g.31798 Transcript_22824/m.31798 type:complete len:238 (-) Transcript_22824:58-771(-)